MLILLLGAQLVIAQHATVHFTEESYATFHLEHNSDATPHSDDHNKDPQPDNICHICNFSKAFAHLLLNDPLLIPIDFFKFTFLFSRIQDLHIQDLSSPYQSRAPPPLLI